MILHTIAPTWANYKNPSSIEILGEPQLHWGDKTLLFYLNNDIVIGPAQRGAQQRTPKGWMGPFGKKDKKLNRLLKEQNKLPPPSAGEMDYMSDETWNEEEEERERERKRILSIE